MAKRILLVHAYQPSIAPIAEAFKMLWPEAEALNVLDETLYADVGADGILAADLPGRVAMLLRHGRQSRADGIIFTGSTFGPAVDAVKDSLGIPVIKADEAISEKIAMEATRALIVCTAKRALPVIRGNVEAAAARLGTSPEIAELWVAGAKDALVTGDIARHDSLIAESVEQAVGYDMIAFGQFSMVPSRRLISAGMAARVITGPEASIARMRILVGG